MSSGYGGFLVSTGEWLDMDDFDVIFYRIDRPVNRGFLDWQEREFSKKTFINSPLGIKETTSKEFMANFRELCPEFVIANGVSDVVSFGFPSIIKPLDGYGGSGIIRLESKDSIECESTGRHEGDDAERVLEDVDFPVMVMRYLNGVSAGDKRIVVVGGVIVGSILRMPAKGGWLCNLAKGGVPELSKADDDEIRIVDAINPIFESKGIYCYGVDTLVSDGGRRIASEVNTTNTGGFFELSRMDKSYNGTTLSAFVNLLRVLYG